MSFPTLIGGAASRYRINQSLRFRASNSAHLTRANVSSPTNTRVFTYSFWAKRGAITASAPMTIIGGGSTPAVGTDNIGFGDLVSGGGGIDQLQIRDTGVGAYAIRTNARFRDPSAWYHVVITVDTTRTTASDRVRLYVNGIEVTSFESSTWPALNYVFEWNQGSQVCVIGRRRSDLATYHYDGYLADVTLIDGQALTPSSFGQTDAATGAWVPRRYVGTYGANGFYLPFDDAASTTTISHDRSGNGNNWTSSGISVTSGVTFDQMLDSPTNNYATLNPLRTTGTLINANLRFQATAGAGDQKPTSSTIYFDVAAANGFYWEIVNNSPSSGVGFSLVRDDVALHVINSAGMNGTSGVINYNPSAGTLQVSGSLNGTYATMGLTDTLSMRVQSGHLWMAVNGTWMNSGNPVATGLTGNWAPAAAAISTSNIIDCQFNFGQRAFAHTPPTGFVALCTANLPTPTIRRGDDAFFAGTRTGTGATASRADLRFPPDLVWVKGRSVTYSHGLYDRVRGASKRLISNLTNAEDTVSGVSAFNSDGFTLGTDINFNEASATYVDWAWREGAAYGFDIVTYTGTGGARTLAHGLNAVPHMIHVKARGSAGNPHWRGWHRGLSANNNIIPSLSDGQYLNTAPTHGGIGGSPTSSDFLLVVGGASADNVNEIGIAYVAYLWTSIPGFSLFGSYTGNGSADGPFVWCGFRPRFVMVKRVDTTGDWYIHDTARSPSNVMANLLFPNGAGAEFNTGTRLFDFTASGFKLRSSDADTNGSSNTFIFAAFAEHPFKFANAR